MAVEDEKQKERLEALWFRLLDDDARTATPTRTALKELVNAMLGHESEEDYLETKENFS
jgi:hypothetical protein